MSDMITVYSDNARLSISKLAKAAEFVRSCTLDKLSKYKSEGEAAYSEAMKVVS